MKTTILTSDIGGELQKKPGRFVSSLFHLILCGLYGILLFHLAFMPARHGLGGGNANAAFQFLILFLALAIIHLFMIFPWGNSRYILFAISIILIITSAMSIALLVFSRPSFNYIRVIIPNPAFIYGLLICSLLSGVFGIFHTGHIFHLPGKKTLETFPFSPGRYRNQRVITAGGVGTIWYAERTIDGIPVVLKIPARDDEKTGMSFLQELSIWRELNHPNIVRVFAVNILPVPYIEMEYFDNSLADMQFPLSVEKSLNIIVGIVSSLAYAHRRNITHCDLKPTNILMDSDDVPKLTDWGLSRSASSRWVVSGFSPRYAAPEQRSLHGECSKATDVWQTGLILTELLTGKTDIPSGDEPVFQDTMGQKILRIIRMCLKEDPNERYPDALVMMEDISQLLLEYPIPF
jgi:hypothetical protein